MSGPGAAVTVVIPVWDDYVQFLPDAVESVRRNSADAPIVVVDNASTTEVPQPSACTVVRAPSRLSAGGARNLGLKRVATEFVVFLDADDMLLEGTLDFLCARIAADETLSVCATSILDGETGERHRTPRRFVAGLAHWRRTFALADAIWSLLPLQGCAILRTADVRAAGGYGDSSLGEDWVLAVSLAWRGRVEVSERLGRFYRPTPGSLWRRPRSPREFAASARLVRERMQVDSAVPRWVRAIRPVVALLQLMAVYVARPAYVALRARVSR